MFTERERERLGAELYEYLESISGLKLSLKHELDTVIADIEDYIRKGANVNHIEKLENGMVMPCLSVAFLFRSPAMVSTLINAGADIKSVEQELNAVHFAHTAFLMLFTHEWEDVERFIDKNAPENLNSSEYKKELDEARSYLKELPKGNFSHLLGSENAHKEALDRVNDINESLKLFQKMRQSAYSNLAGNPASTFSQSAQQTQTGPSPQLK